MFLNCIITGISLYKIIKDKRYTFTRSPVKMFASPTPFRLFEKVPCIFKKYFIENRNVTNHLRNT